MYEPRKLQIEAADELIKKKRAILAEDCGIGKTMIALIAAKKLGLKTYIVCPASAIKNWEQDAELVGTKIERISSWAKFYKIRDQWKHSGLFIVDEAHRAKAWESHRTKAVYHFSKKHDYLFLLSATPSQHKPLDFYWLLKLCGAFKISKDKFRRRFCGSILSQVRTKRGVKWVLVDTVPTNIEQLRGIYNKYKVKKHNRKLKINRHTYFFPSCGLPEVSFSEVSKFRKIVGETKLSYFRRYPKFHDKQAIFFTYHRHIAEELAKILDAPIILGGQSKGVRKKNIKKALQKRQIVVSLKAGGEAINELSTFDTCFFLELSYSPLVDRQAILRMVRSNEDAEINVNYIVAKDEHNYIVQQKKEYYLRGIYGGNPKN